MPVLKCKMCGGNLNIKDNDTVCTCEYCGTTQTIPVIDSEKKARLFNRANDYRLNNDFLRAYNAYEAIVSENPNEAEAYWGMILSEYGVEYVDDPKTGRKIPTCHRTSLKSIKTNSNYQKALEYADIESRMMYEDEAEELDKLQKDILSVSSKEKPYDVFICYKESDDNGERTIDSVIAQELYDELTNRGLNAFFARISLENKFGQNYEPFIYNALRSAKAMLLVTTSNEHCNAPWVKNEWSRYLDFIKNDISRSLIPVIKDMSPYELPDELQKLQVLDLNKIGAKQDLIRGVIKITGKDVPKQTVINSTGNTDSLLKRAKLFLDNGDFKSAGEYCDKVLDIEPENGDAHLTKMFSELKIKSIQEIESLNISLNQAPSYKNVLRFCSEDTKKFLQENNKRIEQSINEKQKTDAQNKKKKAIMTAAIVCVLLVLGIVFYVAFIIPNNKYNKAVQTMNSGDYENAIALFSEVSSFKDSEDLIKECRYRNAIGLYERKDYKDAFYALKALDGYSDSQLYMDKCNDAYIQENTVKVEIPYIESSNEGDHDDSFKINDISFTVEGDYIIFDFDVNSSKSADVETMFTNETDRLHKIVIGNNKFQDSVLISEIKNIYNEGRLYFWLNYGTGYHSCAAAYFFGTAKIKQLTAGAKDLYGNSMIKAE